MLKAALKWKLLPELKSPGAFSEKLECAKGVKGCHMMSYESYVIIHI